jgi:hypothetical protein
MEVRREKVIFPVTERAQCALARTLQNRYEKASRADAAPRTGPSRAVFLVLHATLDSLPSMGCMSGRLRHIKLMVEHTCNTTYEGLLTERAGARMFAVIQRAKLHDAL